MGIALAKIQIRGASEGLHPAATDIATHDPRRNIRSPHQCGEGTGVVATEALLAIKQKGIEVTRGPGLQGVAKGLTSKPGFRRGQPIPIMG